ncbi:MAG TPA: IPExxxVDY family protein [Bacteroidales bacterium]|jgi:hypothetical protein|nr:IPExxxVDY family protein [Bacteroidales bacterium]HBZ22099.1 IPExxxVDY family protein [Bacteroidales bacterium]
MQKKQRITKIQLSVNEQDTPVVLGIVSTEPDYRLSLALNKKLNISLKNTGAVEFQDDKGKKLHFSRFSDSSGSDWHYQLVSNRTEKEFMLKKLINIDYLLLLQKPEKGFNYEGILSQLREIEAITGVFNIEISTLNDKNLKYLI